jgi:hypothetical protein
MTGTPSLRSKTSGSMHGTQRHWTGCWRMTSSTPVYSGDIINKAQNIDWLTKHPRPANSHARFAQLEVRLFGDVAQAYGAVSAQETAVTAEPKS